MIISFLILAFIKLFTIALFFLPRITELPFGIDSFLTNGVHYFNFVADAIPLFGMLWTAFKTIIGIEFGMLVLKLLRVIR